MHEKNPKTLGISHNNPRLCRSVGTTVCPLVQVTGIPLSGSIYVAFSKITLLFLNKGKIQKFRAQ